MPRATRRFPVLAVAFSLLLTAAWPAGARAEGEDEDPKDVLAGRLHELEGQVREHERADDVAALQKDLTLCVRLFEDVKAETALEDRDRDHLLADVVEVAGGLTKHRDDTIKVAAIETLGTLGHERGARYIKRWLRPVDSAAVGPEVNAALAAAGQIADDDLARPLLRVWDDSKNLDVARRALQALGGFGLSRRWRGTILEEVTDSMRRVQPGGPTRGGESRANPGTYVPPKNGTAGGDRWGALSTVVPEVLNELTGQHVATTLDWIRLVQENGRNLDVLFANRDV